MQQLQRGLAGTGVPGRALDLVQGALDRFAALFVVRERASVRATRAQRLALLAILTAGAAVRFWGLGSVGLHGDEETMAMPTLSILATGTPHLPSGMFYPRALVQLYLMAASVALFGESEWALRLPSALCGVLVIALAYLFGRRFLNPTWSLAFAAMAAFLPEFIEYSQTARMYIFMVACVAGFGICVFRWERSGRAGWLIAAAAVMVLGLQFQSLTIFAAPLVLLPGLLHADRRRLAIGLSTLAALGAAFVLIESWVESFYPGIHTGEVLTGEGPAAVVALETGTPALIAGLLVSTLLAGRAAARSRSRGAAAAVSALFALGLALQQLVHYHAAALLLLAGIVLARRSGVPAARLVVILLVSAAIATVHVGMLVSAGVGGQRLIGALVGWPSVWPYVRLLELAPLAFAALVPGAVLALRSLARRRPIGEHWLLFVIGAWAPLLAIGFAEWNVPGRYVATTVLPLLLSATALVQGWVAAARTAAQSSGIAGNALPAGLATVAFVNPVGVAHVIDAGYGHYPDHKGAAEFVSSIGLQPGDVVIAEDVLQQTYYLGRVDYWLVGADRAARFLRPGEQPLRDIYTATPLMGSGAELEALIARRDRGTVYIIGSGEDQSDGRRFQRSRGIHELLASGRFEVIYTGRDGTTKVWRIPPPAAAQAVATVTG